MPIILPWILATTLLGSPSGAEDQASRAGLALSLSQVVEMARSNSPSALAARHRLRSSYWQFVTSRAERRPTLSLSATLPSFARSTSRYTLPDGTDAFIRRSVANSTANLSLTMPFAPTGGQIFLATGLQRIDVLGADYERSYLATPLTVGMRQPLFTHNDGPWQARLDPLRFAEAQRQYLGDLEDIALSATGAFFDLLSAQSTLADAEASQASSDTLLAIARRRRRPVPSSESELLQLELASLNARTQVARARIDLTAKKNQLNSYLGLQEAEDVTLIELGETPVLQVDEGDAILQADRGSVKAISLDRQLLDADRDVAQASSPGTSTALYASFGLSRSTSDIREILRSPERQEEASLGIQVPLVDWGRGKARRRVAESNRELVRTMVEQSRRDLARDVRLQVLELRLQVEQLEIASRVDSLSQRRYRMTRTRYLEGHETVDALNIAQTEKDASRRGYLDALRSFWLKHYELRRETLYDFAKNAPLEPAAELWR